MTAFGYVRKSVMSDDSTTLSPAVQPERVTALAKAHPHDHITILEDLDVAIAVLGPAFLATPRRAARRVHISPR